MNGTTKLRLQELTEKAKGKKGEAYRKAVDAAFSPESIASAKPEHFPKEKAGKMK